MNHQVRLYLPGKTMLNYLKHNGSIIKILLCETSGIEESEGPPEIIHDIYHCNHIHIEIADPDGIYN